MAAPRLGGVSRPTATTHIQVTTISPRDYCKNLHIDPSSPIVSTSSPFSTLRLGWSSQLWHRMSFSPAVTFISSIFCKQHLPTCSFASLIFLTLFHMGVTIYKLSYLLRLDGLDKGWVYGLSGPIRESHFILAVVTGSDLGICHKLSQSKQFSGS